MLLIKNARIINPASKTDEKGDILIDDGVFSSVGKRLSTGDYPDAGLIDAEGLIAAPGFVDVHSHFREPGFPEKETIETGAAAAACGGYTSVVCMANTNPAVDRIERLLSVREKTARVPINVYQASSITEDRKGGSLVDIKSLFREGVRLFTDDGSPIMDEALVREAMELSSSLGAVLSFHEEDPKYIGTAGINQGSKASNALEKKETGYRGADRLAEITMVERDLKLALETGCIIDIQHVSAAESVDLIRSAKERDSRALIHAEATPNHFSLTEDAVLEYGALAKINPPLRTERDRQAIIRGLAEGTIDLIATDHAPHTMDEKKRPLDRAPSGIIGLETAFSLGLKNLVEPGHLTLSQLIAKMSLNPALMLGLRAGNIKEGYPADLVLLNTASDTKYSAFKSRSSNTPFFNKTLPGAVCMTICRGNTVYRNF